ncbi:hypothetical protein GO285_01409 [Ralstonia solanacearum]|nr:hypothetical protein [Ralstonia solanacearum]NKG09626.1 hypothetical protein [Ralstonia solanacearum]
MKSLEEIIREVGTAKYIGHSAPVLDACRQLAVDGRFREIAVLLAGWVQHAPQSEHFVRGALPSIVLNCYLAQKNILTFEQYERWKRDQGDWGKLIREHALSHYLLADAVSATEESMRKAAKALSAG